MVLQQPVYFGPELVAVQTLGKVVHRPFSVMGDSHPVQKTHQHVPAPLEQPHLQKMLSQGVRASQPERFVHPRRLLRRRLLLNEDRTQPLLRRQGSQ